jgi:hypothetical protein
VDTVKKKLGALGSSFEMYNFGIYTNGVNFIADGYIDLEKLDKLLDGKDYITAHDTQSMRNIQRAISQPVSPYDRDNRPHIENLLKVIKWIENLPCPLFDSLREFEQQFPKYLETEFKQITKKKIVVTMHSFAGDYRVEVNWKGRILENLFYFNLDRHQVKTILGESLLGDTKTKVKGIKDTLNILGKRCKIEDVRIYPYIYEYFRVFNTIELYDANVKKDIISDPIRKALDIFYKQLNSYSNHPDNDMYYVGVEQLFIWLDNLNIVNVENHKDLVEKFNSEIDRQHISVDDKMWVKLRYVKGNKGYYGLYVSARNEVAQFVIEM